MSIEQQQPLNNHRRNVTQQRDIVIVLANLSPLIVFVIPMEFAKCQYRLVHAQVIGDCVILEGEITNTIKRQCAYT